MSRSSLLIVEAVPPDSGPFSCRATNNHGEAWMVIRLEIEETPLPPTGLQIMEIRSRSVTIRWKQPAKLTRNLSGYRLQYRRQTEDWTSASSTPLVEKRLFLSGLQPDTEYAMRPFTVTPLGDGPPGRVIHVRTEQAPPSQPPAEVTLVPLTANEVKVNWRPPPVDSHHGRLTGYRVTYQRMNSSTEAYRPRSANTSAGATSVTLGGLHPFAVYQVSVQALNARGAGVHSAVELTRTLEDVPSAPPRTLRCTAAEARQLQISWLPLDADDVNGNLRGYQVKAEALEEEGGELFFTMFEVPGATATVHKLRPHANYTATVAGLTGVGAGVYSLPVTCTTRQDVPSEPAGVAVAATSPQSAVLSWLSPLRPNGVVVSYSIYIRFVPASAAASEERVTVPVGVRMYPMAGLSPRGEYAVRVTARTSAGEGRPSRPLRFNTQMPLHEVPVRMLSLSQARTVDEGAGLTLTCNHVGDPRPSVAWYKDGQDISDRRFTVHEDSSLVLGHVTRRDDGNYTCRVANSRDSASVTYSVTVLGVPPAPNLQLAGASSDSVMVRWSSGDPHGLVIRGYRLHFWPLRDAGQGQPRQNVTEVRVERFVREYKLSDLTCGTVYQLQLRAFNRLGDSEPSAVVEARTAGRAPTLPDPSRLVVLNDTLVEVLLHLWNADGCAIKVFTVRWGVEGSGDKTVSVDLAGGAHKHVLSHLLPDSTYVINVTAISPAGVTSHVSTVRTRPAPAAAEDFSASTEASDLRPAGSVGVRVVLPVLVSLVSLLMIASAAYLCVRKRRRKVPLYLPEPTDFTGSSCTFDKHLDPPPPPALPPPSSDQLKREELCPYATFYPRTEVRGPVLTSSHYASMPAALTSEGTKDVIYADPRAHQQLLQDPQQRQRVRSLPVSDEYDSPESDTDSPAGPGHGRSTSLHRGHRAHSRDTRQYADSSSSSGQISPDLRSRSLSSRRPRRKRRRAKTPVLLPPSTEYAAAGTSSSAQMESLILQQLQLQRELAATRTGESHLDLRTLAHTLKGRDFSINV